MSEFARLEEKLAKLRDRERAPGEPRKLRGSDVAGLVSALVTEIDETILPRRLSLQSDTTQIHLAVANRRLQALLSPAPSVDGAAELADKALPDAEDPGVPALLEVLNLAFAEGGSIRVSTARLSSPFGSDIGIPANLLARAWNVSDELSAPKDPAEILSIFLAGLTDDAHAWLRIEGEAVTDQGGEQDRIVALGEQAAYFLDGYFAKFDMLFPEDSPAVGTLISAGKGAGAALFFVEIGEESAFVAVKSGKEGAVVGRWQGLVSD